MKSSVKSITVDNSFPQGKEANGLKSEWSYILQVYLKMFYSKNRYHFPAYFNLHRHGDIADLSTIWNSMKVSYVNLNVQKQMKRIMRAIWARKDWNIRVMILSILKKFIRDKIWRIFNSKNRNLTIKTILNICLVRIFWNWNLWEASIYQTLVLPLDITRISMT